MNQDAKVHANSKTCSHCDRGNEEDNRFCVHCGQSFPERGGKTRVRALLFGGIPLLLLGTFGLFASGAFEPKAVGLVNEEKITRKEFTRRLDRAKTVIEFRNGKDFFQGQRGEENLNRLKAQTFDDMVAEKILLQAAKAAGHGPAPEEEIVKQVEVIMQRHGLTEADFEKKIRVSLDDFKEDLRKDWIISQFIQENVLKGVEGNREVYFGEWFSRAKQNARIVAYERLAPASAAKASSCPCCASGCGGGGKALSLDPKTEQEAKSKALDYYEKKTQRKGENAKVTNFGCHIQVDILEGGKVVVSLTYLEGKIQEI